MSIKLVALDLDGTLLRNDHLTVSDRNREAICRASAQGTEFVIASGRPICFCRSILSELPMVRYMIQENGASVVDLKTQETLYAHPFSSRTSRYALEVLSSYPVCLLIFSGGSAYISQDRPFYNRYLPEAFARKMPLWCREIPNLIPTMRSRVIDKIDIVDLPDEKQEEIETKLCKDPDIAITTSIPGNIEINSAKISKGKGLKKLCERLHIKPEEVLAFGDSTNDVEMLSFAGHSYAMKNAHIKAKQAAKNAAPSNEEDGVAAVLNQLL